MEYVITFLEGIISFISPCMLPMIPLYISYFAGEGEGKKKAGTMLRALFFVLGFTVVFCALGVFAGSIGMALTRHQRVVDIVCGLLVIFFGLSYLEVFHLNFLKGVQGEHRVDGLFSALLFGMVYSVSLTPCVGAFLGSALMLAGSRGGAVKGGMLLLIYSLGLGIPFLLSALLIDRLKGAFTFIKQHYKVVNLICGLFLILVGICMALGWMNKLIGVLV